MLVLHRSCCDRYLSLKFIIKNTEFYTETYLTFIIYNKAFTKHAGIVMFYSCNLADTRFKALLDTGYPDEGFCGFSQQFQGNAGMVPQLSHSLFPSHSTTQHYIRYWQPYKINERRKNQFEKIARYKLIDGLIEENIVTQLITAHMRLTAVRTGTDISDWNESNKYVQSQ